MKQSCPVPRAFRLSVFYTLEGVVARMDAMQQELKAFKDPALARGLIESIQALAPESATLMEVCGTHTVGHCSATAFAVLCPRGFVWRRALDVRCA